MKPSKELLLLNLGKAFDKTLRHYEEVSQVHLNKIETMKAEVYGALASIKGNVPQPTPYLSIEQTMQKISTNEISHSPVHIQEVSSCKKADKKVSSFKLFNAKTKPLILNSSSMKDRMKELSQTSHRKSKSEAKLKLYLRTEGAPQHSGGHTGKSLKKTHSLSSSMTVSSYMDKLEATPKPKRMENYLNKSTPRLFN